jgi:GTP-binding protein Era
MFKAGFVSIFGRPNAGKSTLLNALVGEKLAIVSPKVQTTRHRIKAFLSGKDYQVILSDTPGIIEPRYKLHERMMQSVRASLEDADLAIFLVDLQGSSEEQNKIFESLKIKAPAMVILNKIDSVSTTQLDASRAYFSTQPYCKRLVAISALQKKNLEELKQAILAFMPEGQPFYEGDDLSDLPTKFFVGEMIREKIYLLYEEEIPYHAAVLVNEFKEKTGLIKISADIIVQRETQKGIILGQGGKMIRQLGTEARKDIEAFLGSKVFLELFVKVRPHWRDNDIHLKEYGYHGG